MFEGSNPSSPDPLAHRTPTHPATQGRLSAMCRSLVLAIRGPEADRPWAAEIEGGLLKAARRLDGGDRERLQAAIDEMVDKLNEGAIDGSG